MKNTQHEMKVLMINYEYPPLGGGTAKACKKIIENKPNNMYIHLITSSKSDYSMTEGEKLKIERLKVGKKHNHSWRFEEVFQFVLRACYKTRKLLDDEEFDLVHAWTGFPCGVVARQTGSRYIVTLRGGDVPGFDTRFKFFYPFLKPLICNIWHNSERVIPNSIGLKQLAQETSDIEMKVIPNGVDTKKFYCKTSYKNNYNQLRVVTVCRLSSMKRVSDIIHAVKALRDVQLDIIGSGDMRNELKKLVQELDLESQVHFHGHINHEKLPKYLNDYDIFILPSLNEGMSNAILEAMASGLPIITTNVGGSKELIRDNGFIVGTKNPKDIRSSIEKYFNNPSLLEKHGKRSRQLAESYDWESVSKKFYQTYFNLKQ